MIRPAIVLVLALLCCQTAHAADTHVSLLLKWRNAFQFAGFYMAVEKGYYHDEGLDVELIEGGPGKSYIRHVLQPGANYSIADSSALVARAEGKPVKAIAAIFQHSPLALLVLKKSGIRSFKDLRGKRIMMQPGLNDDILPALQMAGIGQKDFTRQSISYDIRDLIDGKTDAYAAYITDQPQQLKRLGIPYRILRPSQYGIDFYGDTMITSDREIRRHPERVNAMIRASVKGWTYALNHPDEAVDLILRKYNTRHLTADRLYHEARITAKMVFKNVVQVGYMSNYRWQLIANTYAQEGVIPKDFRVADFVYRPAPGLTDTLEHYRWQLAVSALLLLLLAVSLHAYLLRRTVRSRTTTLRENEARLRTLIDNIPGTIFRARFNDTHQFDFMSGEIEAISGYAAEEFLSGRRRFDSIAHPDDLPHLVDTIELSIRTSEPYSIEYRIITRDGATRWVLEKGQSVFDAQDRFKWIDGNIIDIDSRKRGEDLMQVTSEILEMIAGNVDPDAIFARIIETFELRRPGMRASILRLQDNRLYKAAAPNLPEAYNEFIEGTPIGPRVGSCGTAAYTGKRVIVENILEDERWADYADAVREFPMRACWSEPVFDADGEVLGTFAMYHDHPRIPDEEEINDISHAARLASIAISRDRNLERLRMLSLAVEQAGEIIMITDRDGVLEYVNPAFSKQTGYSKEEAIGRTPAILNSGKQNQAFYRHMWNTIQGGETWQGRIIEERKNGERYPAMLTISPLRDERGEISHYVGVHEDLTDLHHMEEQFHQAQKMETIGTLVGGIAHDFNNMLAGITGNLYLARAQLADSPDKARNALEKIDHITMRASDIVSQLLTFANKGMVEKKTFPLTPLLKEAVKLQRVSIPENVAFEIDLCREDLPVFADATQLQQITLNLLNNARDAIAEMAHPAITIRLQPFQADSAFLARHPQLKTAKLAHLQISDNGHGIKPEHIHSIFEPFFTTKEVGKGTGLGLAMVFGAVQSNDGVITVESEPNAGTTFHIYLPLTGQSDTSDDNQSKPEVMRGDGELILLADDDPLVIESSSAVLQELGYTVLTADNGCSAVETFRSCSGIRLVMLDVVMPSMNGPQAADEIRRLDPETRIIFATGYDRDAALTDADGLTSEIVLTKPFTVAELSGVLRDQLSAVS
ncbi:MAG TPA: ABC transporter substrate-binding protein [Mariprofundaceae bacterium]|nr:ABC transporter substrate-binding protein [Mariprofundaceae bacterium]